MNEHRTFDLAIAVLLLPFALAIGSVIALAIWLDSPGPIIYRCRRVGHKGRTFEMLKFRKMRHGACGPAITGSYDERFTPIGRFLAVTRLDELPQIWNVLRGEMRLVGPRPEVEEFVCRHQGKYDEILGVVPGITGFAQLEFAGEHRLFEPGDDPTLVYLERIFPHKIELDLEYIATRSLRRDLAILSRTVLLPFLVLQRRCRRAFARLARRHIYAYAAIMVTGIVLVAAFAAQAGPVR